MDDSLKEKVGLLRERIKSSPDPSALYRELSDLLFQSGKMAAAMNVLERSLEGGRDMPGNLQAASPPPPDPLGREGKWLFDRGLEFADAYLYEDAVECFLQSLEAGQDSFETHYCLSGVYKSLDKPVEAERHCRRSIELNARFTAAYILLGAILKRPGRLEESVLACKKALLLDPDCTAAYYDLACYYSLLDKREPSLAALEMAFCKGFSDFEWLLRDPDLESVRANPEFSLLMRTYREKGI